jgi:hypothetical protein
MINPNVSNIDRSESFIAVVLDDLFNAGLSSMNRVMIEKAVKETKCGSTTNGRYFLKGDERVSSYASVRKTQTIKRRCCSINRSSIDKSIMLSFEQGKLTSCSMMVMLVRESDSSME